MKIRNTALFIAVLTAQVAYAEPSDRLPDVAFEIGTHSSLHEGELFFGEMRAHVFCASCLFGEHVGFFADFLVLEELVGVSTGVRIQPTNWFAVECGGGAAYGADSDLLPLLRMGVSAAAAKLEFAGQFDAFLRTTHTFSVGTRYDARLLWWPSIAGLGIMLSKQDGVGPRVDLQVSPVGIPLRLFVAAPFWQIERGEIDGRFVAGIGFEFVR